MLVKQRKGKQRDVFFNMVLDVLSASFVGNRLIGLREKDVKRIGDRDKQIKDKIR